MQATSQRPHESSPAPPPEPVYVICGTEQFLIDLALREVRQRTVGPAPNAMSSSEFGPDAVLADVLDELRTLPLLATHRLVIVRDADPFISAHRESLERYCAAPTPTASLLLVCKTFNKRTRLYRAVDEHGKIITCQPPTDAGIPAWLCRRVQAAYGKRMDPRTAHRLHRLVGSNLAMLDQELSKLALYVGNREAIGAADVGQLVGLQREAKVFGIVDALARKDAVSALNLWQEVWMTDRAAPGRAIGGLAWALRRRLENQARIPGSERVSEPPQRSTSGQPSPAAPRPAALEEIEAQVRDLLQADVNVKTGLGKLQHAIEKLIVVHCGASQTRHRA